MKKVVEKKKEITMNDLATMVTQNSSVITDLVAVVAKVSKKTDDLAVSLAKVSKKTDDLAVGLAEVNKKTDDLAILVDGLAMMTAKRFDGVESRLDKVEDRLGKVEDNVVDTNLRISSLSDRTVQRYEFDDFKIRFNRLEQKVAGKTKR